MDEPISSGIAADVKRLLGDPTKRIDLDDFVIAHLRAFLDRTSIGNFSVQGPPPTKEDVASRLAQYEEAASDLQTIVVLVAKWATTEQVPILENAFAHVIELDRAESGLTVWLTTRWYPALYLMYSAGIAALASKNYVALAAVLRTPVDDDGGRRRPSQTAITRVIEGVSDATDIFKLLPGQERKHTPRSEHLFEVLHQPLDELLHAGRRYELLFDTFELFAALTFAETSSSGWVPAGRYAWKYRNNSESGPLARLRQEAEAGGEKWRPLRAGMFAGSLETFSAAVKLVEDDSRRRAWW